MRKQRIKIYIIESPAPEDILEDKREGYALLNMLRLAKIPTEYYDVVNYDTFRQALEMIAADFKASDGLNGIAIHFSMHGDEDGLQLTSYDDVDWADLQSLLQSLNEDVGYLKGSGKTKALDGKYFSRVALSFSTCKGYHGGEMNNFGEYGTFGFLVGPPEEVHWADSLLAFATYYHNIFHLETSFPIALERMNVAIGQKDAFKYVNGKLVDVNP